MVATAVWGKACLPSTSFLKMASIKRKWPCICICDSFAYRNISTNYQTIIYRCRPACFLDINVTDVHSVKVITLKIHPHLAYKMDSKISNTCDIGSSKYKNTAAIIAEIHYYDHMLNENYLSKFDTQYHLLNKNYQKVYISKNNT